MIDGMILELDPEKTGFIDIMSIAKAAHNVKDDKEGGGGSKKKNDGTRKKT